MDVELAAESSSRPSGSAGAEIPDSPSESNLDVPFEGMGMGLDDFDQPFFEPDAAPSPGLTRPRVSIEEVDDEDDGPPKGARYVDSYRHSPVRGTPPDRGTPQLQYRVEYLFPADFLSLLHLNGLKMPSRLLRDLQFARV